MNGLYHFLKGRGIMVASLIGLVLSLLCYLTIIPAFPDLTPAGGVQMKEREIMYASGAFDYTLYVNEFLTLIAFFVILPAAALLGVARNPKGSIFGIIGVVVVLVLFGVFYVMGSDVMTPAGIKMGLTPGNMKFVDACLYISYLFVFASILAPVALSIYGAIRNR